MKNRTHILFSSCLAPTSLGNTSIERIHDGMSLKEITDLETCYKEFILKLCITMRATYIPCPITPPSREANYTTLVKASQLSG